MKRLFIALMVFGLCTGCSDNDSGTGNRQENMGTLNDSIGGTDTGIATNDTTPTTNNNVYNTDSASGQGNRYDTSNRKPNQ